MIRFRPLIGVNLCKLKQDLLWRLEEFVSVPLSGLIFVNVVNSFHFVNATS